MHPVSRRGIVYLYQGVFTGFEQVNLVAYYDTHHGREFRKRSLSLVWRSLPISRTRSTDITQDILFIMFSYTTVPHIYKGPLYGITTVSPLYSIGFPVK